MDLFTRAQWYSRAGSRASLNRALRRGEIWPVIRGVYADASVPDCLETRCRAVNLLRPEQAVIADETAAWLAGIDMLPPGQDVRCRPTRLIIPDAVTHPRRPEWRGRQASVPDDDIVVQHGVPRTSDLRTACDLVRYSPRETAVAAGDAFLNARRFELGEIWDRARLLRGVRNCRILRANLAACDPGAQSYAESAERVLFIDAGLPRPTTQIPVYGPDGQLLGFLDMGWPEWLVAAEFDGEESHDSAEQREHDRRRRAAITLAEGWRIGVARKQQLWGQPAQLVQATAQMLLERGWPGPPAVLDQISRAAEYEATTGRRWVWMPLERLLAT